MLRDLRDIAFDVSSLSDTLSFRFDVFRPFRLTFSVNSQNSECMESAGGAVAKALSNCMTDRQVAQSKRRGAIPPT